MKKLVFSALAMVGFVFGANAQVDNTDNHTVTIIVPEVALLDLEKAGGSATGEVLSFQFTKPTEEGDAIVKPADINTLWLNYSSIIDPAGGTDLTRTVSVSIAAMVPGVQVKITAGSATGTTGTVDADGGVVTFASQATATAPAAQTILTGIGSCYTGTGNANGHQLTYEVTAPASNYAALTSGTTSGIQVTYTLSDTAPLAN